jgi:hypothetical protein
MPQVVQDDLAQSGKRLPNRDRDALRLYQQVLVFGHRSVDTLDHVTFGPTVVVHR